MHFQLLDSENSFNASLLFIILQNMDVIGYKKDSVHDKWTITELNIDVNELTQRRSSELYEIASFFAYSLTVADTRGIANDMWNDILLIDSGKKVRHRSWNRINQTFGP